MTSPRHDVTRTRRRRDTAFGRSRGDGSEGLPGGPQAPARNRCRRVAFRAQQRQSVPCLEVGARPTSSVGTGVVRRLCAQTLAQGRGVSGLRDGRPRWRVHFREAPNTRPATRSARPAGARHDRADVGRLACLAISLGLRQIFWRVWDRWRAIRLCRTREMEVVVEETGRVLVLSVPEAARLLGISRTHAYGLVARGELVHVRLGRRIVVPRRAIEKLLEAPTDGPAAA